MKNWLISWGERTTARLRAKADAIRAEAERREREHLIRVAIVKRNADAVVAGREFERTAIVEFLRALPYRPWSAEVADRIALGEHMAENTEEASE